MAYATLASRVDGEPLSKAARFTHNLSPGRTPLGFVAGDREAGVYLMATRARPPSGAAIRRIFGY